MDNQEQDLLKIISEPTVEETRTAYWGVFFKKHLFKLCVFAVFFFFLAVLLFLNLNLTNLVLAIICLVFAVLFPGIRVLGILAVTREASKFSLVVSEKDLVFTTDEETFSESILHAELFDFKDVWALVVDNVQYFVIPKRCVQDTEAFEKLFIK